MFKITFKEGGYMDEEKGPAHFAQDLQYVYSGKKHKGDFPVGLGNPVDPHVDVIPGVQRVHDAGGLRAGHEADGQGNSSEKHGHENDDDNDSPAFFHSAATSL